MRTILQGALLSLLIIVVADGCYSEPRQPIARRPVAPPLAAVNGARNSDTFRLSPDNTQIEFVGSAGRNHQRGKFTDFSGMLTVPNGNVNSTSLSMNIELDSVSTSIFLLTRHLKGEDFFDVKKYPQASFVTNSIEQYPTATSTHRLVGNFQFHGVTRQMAIPARIAITGDMLFLKSTFVIQQADFGMTEDVRHSDNEVPVTVSVRAPRR
jgi:polyisoprenoid-binding protein YceI